MAAKSPRANLQNSRRPIADGSVEGIQSGKIPIIKVTPRAEKANADVNDHVLQSGPEDVG